jgi:hypothetical protein
MNLTSSKAYFLLAVMYGHTYTRRRRARDVRRAAERAARTAPTQEESKIVTD